VGTEKGKMINSLKNIWESLSIAEKLLVGVFLLALLFMGGVYLGIALFVFFLL
jgi:hypothetical protein